MLLQLCCIYFLFQYGAVNASDFSRSVANFLNIQKEGNKTSDIATADPPWKRNELLPIVHGGWNQGLFHHHNRLNVPDFGYHDLHESNEHGEKLQMESHPRHYTHHEPHYPHEIFSHHHGDYHPHEHHEHYVTHEPMHHGYSMMQHHGHPMLHHYGHHYGHHEEEESGDHDEHHDYGEEAHGEGDWDVGGGYFQLEEHGSDVNIVALKKHGTKVHMSGGDFNVIRDPWRQHSLFAGLFHPHEMPGHGHLPMEQFHQHFTYIANDKAINHHTYEHDTHIEDNDEHGHHEHEEHGGHGHGGHDEHGKREYFPSSSVSVSMAGQTKQEISEKPEGVPVMTIPLHKIPLDTAEEGSSKDAALRSQNADVRSAKDDDDKKDDERKLRKEQPRVEAPHFEPLNGVKYGPKVQSTVVEIPLSPLFKRQLIQPSKRSRDERNRIAMVRIVKRSAKEDQPHSRLNRESRLARAFLGKLLVSKANRYNN